MSFSFNGNTPRKIIFNNQDVKKLIYNNDVVWEKKRLPVEYQEVEYIESTGTQYIDTNLLYVTNDRIEIDVAPVVITQDRVVFGSYISSAYVELGILASKFRFDISDSATTSITENVRYKVVKDGATWTVDGNTITTSGSNKNTPYPIYLFGRCFNGTAQKMSKIKLYSYKQIRNNVTIADFIPCYRKIDKKPGLYDAFNDVFYTNDGTGEFNVGADIITIPAEYQRVEYIQASGKQYIDTNYTPNQNTKAYTKFNSDTLNSGLYSSSNKFTAYINTNGNWRFGSTTVRITPSIGVLYTSVQDKTGVIINETDVYNYDGTVTDFTSTATLRLMFNSTGFKGKIYEFKLYDNDILVRNFIPCYRKSDNVAGMYDIVSGKFFTNDGTGSFAVGNNI